MVIGNAARLCRVYTLHLELVKQWFPIKPIHPHDEVSAYCTAQKGLRAVYADDPRGACYAREKPRRETGTTSQVKRQPWTL